MKLTQFNQPDQQPAPWDYSIKYSRRKTIGIYVSAENGVEVRVPYFVARQEAVRFVESKRDWIESQLASIASRPRRFEPDYSWGGSFYFLGERQVIHWREEPGVDLVIKGAANDGAEEIEPRVQRWFRQQALELFVERHQFWREQMQDLNLPASTMGVRAMKRRWGSCRRSGQIVLNSHLARYPLNCVDVVVVHELCHLLEFNHSKRFYQLMGAVMPDWKQHDSMLNRLSLLY